MRSRSSRHAWILALLSLPLASSGCGLILGLDEYTLIEGSGGGTTTSSGTAGGPTGTGGGPTCMPNEMVTCYSGPPGTEGIGPCKAGTAICTMEGTPGPCMGEMLPSAEVCTQEGDEDCDGIPCSETIWSGIFGDDSFQEASSVAIDNQGNIIVAGYFLGSIKFGNFSLIAAGVRDFFLTKLDSKGTPIWAKKFGDATDNGSLPKVAVDSGGNIIMAGELKGSADFGGGTVQSAGAEDIFVVKFDPMGNYKWGKLFGDSASQRALSVAVDSQGDVVLAGIFAGTLSLGGSTFTCVGNQNDAFLAKLTSANGAHLWSKPFKEIGGSPASPQTINIVTTDASNNILLAGGFIQSADFGGGPLSSPSGAEVIAKYDSAGNHSWSQSYSGTVSQTIMDIATDSSGSVVLLGKFDGAINFGGSDLNSNGSTDIFVAKLNPVGTHQWSMRFGSASVDNASRVVADAADDIILTGSTPGNIDFGGAVLNNASSGGTYDMFVAKLDASGKHRWSRMFGDAADQFGTALGVDPMSRSIVFAGTTQGTVDFGTGPLTTAGDRDVVIAQFYP